MAVIASLSRYSLTSAKEPDMEFIFHLVKNRHATCVGGSEVVVPIAVSVQKLNSNTKNELHPIAWDYRVHKPTKPDATDWSGLIRSGM